MPITVYTPDECRAMLHEYMEAEKTVLSGGQSYTINGRALTRASLAEIRAGQVQWKKELSEALNRCRPRCRSIIPHG